MNKLFFYGLKIYPSVPAGQRLLCNGFDVTVTASLVWAKCLHAELQLC